MPEEDTMGAYSVRVPETWTVADGQVSATLSSNLTIQMVWKPASQGDAAGFQAELYSEGHLLSTASWEWQVPDISEFIQIVKPADALSALADVVDEEDEESLLEESTTRHPEHSLWQRLKPALNKTFAWIALVALWTADRLIDLMLFFQAGQRRIAPTKRIAWPQGLKERLMRRQRNLCAYCGRRYSSHYFDIDHMDPAVDGGPNDVNNLQVLCGPCNRRKRDQTDREFRRRYAELVPSERRQPPSRPVTQRQFDAVTRRTEASTALQQRRRSRFTTAREKILTGSLVCGFATVCAGYLALDGLGIEGNWAVYPALVLGIVVGAGLVLRARVTGALYV